MARSKVVIEFSQTPEQVDVINQATIDTYVDIEFNITKSPFVPFSAIGGDNIYEIIQGGNLYRVHEFTTTGTSTFELPIVGTFPSSFDYLIVAGGGGGGLNRGGGGGAGGILTGTTTLGTGTYSIVVGNGGGVQGNGENSEFNGLVALGGGGGAPSTGDAASKGSDGGSGGGNGWNLTSPGGAGTPGQGNDGASSGNGPSGGGGGAGAAGGTGPVPPGQPSSTNGCNGGNGIEISITGTSTWYGGGGGGGEANWDACAPGGMGGGADGSPNNPSGSVLVPRPAVPNTGGGGGSNSAFAGNTSAPAGASGIVIIRYPIGYTTSSPDPSFRFRNFSFGWEVFNNGVSVGTYEFPTPVAAGVNEPLNTARLISTNQSLILTDRYVDIPVANLSVQAWVRNNGILYQDGF